MYGSLFFLYRKINQRPAGGYHHLHTLKNQPKSIQIRDPQAGFRVPFFTPPKKSFYSDLNPFNQCSIKNPFPSLSALAAHPPIPPKIRPISVQSV